MGLVRRGSWVWVGFSFLLAEDSSPMWLLERTDKLYSDVAANAASFNAMTVAMLGSRLARERKDYFAEHHRGDQAGGGGRRRRGARRAAV